MYEEFKNKAALWDANFHHRDLDDYTNIHDAAIFAANQINLPHEDYPLRVPMTTEILITPMSIIDINEYGLLGFTRQVHHMLFSGDLSVPGINGGMYRNHSVSSSGGHEYVNPLQVHGLMESFFEDFWKLSPTMMYKVFESIHPFPDGNGRVGGILLFVHSFITSNGSWVVIPGQ